MIEVPAGERPLLERDATLGDRVRLIVEAAGPSRPTPPRDWALPLWIWASAALVAALQLTSGGWRRLGAVVPWSLLVSGQVAARAWVEPLRLVGERFAVDLCLAAVLAAWLPAAWMWLRRGRWLRAAAWLLLPLALATPHLTPPLYGDEPFHLAVMESLTADHDLDISDNLDLERRPGNRTYLLGDPLLHSPVLGFLLMPGYLVAGRSGALFLLALMGALLVALIARAGHRLGVPGRRLALLLLGLLVTYPLAVFATQIWPELPGALAVGLMLGLADHPRGPWIGTASLVVAAAVKTRLGLVTFPPALVLWWRRRGGARIAGLVVLAAAAGLALAVGWLAMGHPFGFFRRLGHLVPQDPLIAARVVGGLLFDHAGGLALAAPLLLVAVASVGVLWRRGGARSVPRWWAAV